MGQLQPQSSGESEQKSSHSKSWEVEQKYRVDSLERVRQSIERMGGKFLGDEQQVDHYLAHPCRDFKATDEALRVRVINNSSVVTFKGPRRPGPMKSRPELEIPLVVDTESAWMDLWQHLGFREVAAVRKKRSVMELRFLDVVVTIALDRVENVGEFVELELIVHGEDGFAQAEHVILSLAQSLSIQEVERRSYLSMLLAYQSQSTTA